MTNSENIKVWLVDDDDSVRWVLEKAMQRAAIDVRGFAEPTEALDALLTSGNGSPDVIITDIRMPGMDGLELMTRLEKQGITVPVIVI